MTKQLTKEVDQYMRDSAQYCERCWVLYAPMYLVEGYCPHCYQWKDSEPIVTRCKNCNYYIIDSDQELCDECRETE